MHIPRVSVLKALIRIRYAMLLVIQWERLASGCRDIFYVVNQQVALRQVSMLKAKLAILVVLVV